MKLKSVQLLGASLLLQMSASSIYAQTPLSKASLKGDEIIETVYGDIELENNFINKGSEELFDAMDFQRASQAYIWSTPIVSMKTWGDREDAAYDAAGLENFVVLKSLKEKRGIVTGNLTTPYIFTFSNLKDGAVKVDYPKGMTAGGFLDLWQRPVADLGLTGPDKGQGGTYIICGPSDNPDKYKGQADFIVQSETNNFFIGLRILEADPSAVDKFKSNLKLGKVGTKLKDASFIEDKDVEWSATAPRDLDYWKKLHTIINEEPVREQDKAWIAMIKPLGIEIGKPFNPTARQKENLMKGLKMGELMLRNLQTNPRFSEPYWAGTNWYKSFDFNIPQANEMMVYLDERAVWYYEAVSSTKGMVEPSPGYGQIYMTSKRDQNGDLLRADQTYKLHVPADVPVDQFWSVTLYSEDTRRPYDNGGTEIADIGINSRRKDVTYNKDGSIDIYIGAERPEGVNPANYLKTVGDDGWFIYFRLYAPREAFFDKSFQLPDWEKITSGLSK
ncbi:DUF1254 domain-containing protein [Flammeovirga agarivorans]|uniref:DUF1254 domain-containing protein n=1 Tax=Flammeovirga agarivorans TaxID=2726742 RepID=A0A7X8XZ67_9BACT|nr:DUF1254 domain-containing protein [Flammeovirga agarivorans]NLR94700.1 DUF1254 domain-containing protein [Flammeovirga agarivorans]